MPLRNATGANWLRQHYFRRAIAEHGKVHVTRPYLSITDASPCITLSVALPVEGKLRVLCADLTAEGLIRDAAEKAAGEAPEVESHDLRGRAEQMLRAAGCAYAKAMAKTQIAKAQVEMMARVQAEQQAIAEKRARAAAEDRAKVPDAVSVHRARSLRVVARRAADAILFRKRKRALSYSPAH